ncbi:tetratricopeptide repeat protein [Solitalea canadensis]|uniref:Tetratricopeptide repeat protein n=1 Tax=Solitalea canadensis (strain ATCC 29591 / DSM 3403 / JCM 21819 / LMG 8368 / NBRC 15130 / NCIMB 12057 / USAM 9D) TaxID=929556 RepID=H8KMG0_SOLCM|nr:tetratricopeptide repeat protein [Solitalea canadensis]AFD08755.1 hypothetical protein Solca_3755 [Solitalea canadensis DSM 3403]
MKNLFLLIVLPIILTGSSSSVIISKESLQTKAPSSIPLCYGFSIDMADTSRPALYNGLGMHHLKVSTKNDFAAKYFNQGIILYYGFNHPEAYRSFKEAARLDPEMAMAYWGQALSMGPNINMPMDPTKTEEVYQLVQKALSLKGKSTETEQAYIDAIAKRYSKDPKADRVQLDKDYAAAMKLVKEKYPSDLDALTLYAESLMDIHPWDFWTAEGKPKPWTNEIVETLETVLKKDPSHVGANHFYIHAVEASDKPGRGLASADRLQTLVPGAGHLVHMPSHIYVQTGQYDKGSSVNREAISVDTKSLKDGMKSVAYPEHNIHFLYTTLALEGKSKEALANARLLQKSIPPEFLDDPLFSGYAQHLYSTYYFAMVRFGLWDDILKEKAPAEKYKYLQGLYHYAKGMAYVKTNKPDSVLKEHSELLGLIAAKEMQELAIWQTNTASKLLQIAADVLEGEFYAAKKDYSKALLPLQKAIKQEDALVYNEPFDWPNPVRNNYGAILLENNRFTEAESVYNKALKKYPDNGWSLFGLYQTLKAENKTSEAEIIKKRYDKAFANSDLKLTSSRF